jgi:hypothetical protein
MNFYTQDTVSLYYIHGYGNVIVLLPVPMGMIKFGTVWAFKPKKDSGYVFNLVRRPQGAF